jgi:hypothetical protein
MPTDSSPAALPGSAFVGRAQIGVLRMPRGHATSRFTIDAPPPPEHAFRIRITIPPAARVSVRIHTWYGTTLNILNSTRDPQSCRFETSRTVCLCRFPRLEAQKAGNWVVIAAKRTLAAATVRIAVVFD